MDTWGRAGINMYIYAIYIYIYVYIHTYVCMQNIDMH